MAGKTGDNGVAQLVPRCVRPCARQDGHELCLWVHRALVRRDEARCERDVSSTATGQLGQKGLVVLEDEVEV